MATNNNDPAAAPASKDSWNAAIEEHGKWCEALPHVHQQLQHPLARDTDDDNVPGNTDGNKQRKEFSEINDIINKIQEVEKKLEADDDDDDNQNHPTPFLIWTGKMGWEEIAHAKQQATNKLEQLKSKLTAQGKRRKAAIEKHQWTLEEIHRVQQQLQHPLARDTDDDDDVPWDNGTFDPFWNFERTSHAT